MQRSTISPDAAPADTAPSVGVIEQVTDSICGWIRAGKLVPGQHLVEPDLTRQLGISRGSLREAFKHLAAAGVIKLSRFRGAYIDSLDRKASLDLLDTLEPLARLGACLAAKNCDTPEKRERMGKAAQAIENPSRRGAGGGYLEQRWRFYDTMIQIADNNELARVIPLPRTDLLRAQVESAQTEAHRERHLSGYGKIAKAIIAQDPAAAEKAIKRHFDGTRQTIDDLPDSAFPRPETA